MNSLVLFGAVAMLTVNPNTQNLATLTVETIQSIPSAIESSVRASEELKTASESNAEALVTPWVSEIAPMEDWERQYIFHVVAGEARGEDYLGKVAVCQTIYDRSVLKNKTPYQVVTEPTQFSGYYKGYMEQETIDEINLAIDNVFLNGHRVFERRITMFHADYSSPSWRHKYELAGKIDGQYFYYAN